jgi:antitoxin ParD1/3/4
MAHSNSIALGEHFDHFVSEKLGSGQYASVSEVVRAGLRLLEEREQRLQSLRAQLAEGYAQAARAEFSEGELQSLLDEIDQEK